MAGCKFSKRVQNQNHLFLINVILSLLPHRAVDKKIIVETAANAIRSIAFSYLSNESFPALKQMLITYSDNALIFQAIASTIASC
jgi:hypothetical protein